MVGKYRKRALLAALLLLVQSVLSYPLVKADTPYILMDADGSGTVSIADLVLVKKHVAGQSVLKADWQRLAADADENGTIDAYDLVLIKKNLLGLYISSMNTWVCDSLTDVFMDTVMPSNAPQQADIHMAKNEREGVHIAFENKRETAEDLRLTILPFTEPDAPELITHVTGYAEATQNSGYISPDHKRFDGRTMVPSYYVETNSAGNTPPYTSGSFWVEAVTQKNTAPGTYKTSAVLSCGKGQIRVPITVTVYDTTLPDPADSDFSYTCWGELGALYGNNFEHMYRNMFGIEYFDDNYWELQKNFAIAQKNERQNVCMVPLSRLLGDGLTIDYWGNYTFDFTTFNKYVRTYLENGSYKYLCGTHLLDKDWYIDYDPNYFPLHATVAWVFQRSWNGAISTRWAFTDSPEAQNHLTQLLTALYANLCENGWEDMWIQHVCDEASGPNQIQEITGVYQLVHTLMPGAKTVDAGAGLHARYGSELNFPAAQLNDYDSNRNAYRTINETQADIDVWFYTCTNPQGSFMSRLDDFPLLSTRALGWYAYKENLKGYLHWSWNLWYTGGGSPYDPLSNIDHPGGPLDGWLVFPNAEEYSVYEGPRSTAVRDGFEDRELMVLAAQKNSVKVRGAVDALIEWGNVFDRDHTKYLEARKMFLEIASK